MKKENKFQIVSMNEGLAQMEGRQEIAPKKMPDNIQDLPISGFLCHLTDRTRARAKLNEMANTVYDQDTKKTMQNIPLKIMAGVEKNMLIAVSGDIKIFTINLKTGRMFHE